MTELELSEVVKYGYQIDGEMLWCNEIEKQSPWLLWILNTMPYAIDFSVWLTTWVFLHSHKTVKVNGGYVILTPTSFKRALWIAVRSYFGGR